MSPRRIAITGASGLVGRALVPHLRQAGWRVQALVRRPPRQADEIHWDPAARTVDAAGLEGVEAVVHLAGENVGDGRWTAARKAAILGSRVDGTTALAQALAGLSAKPRVLVSASAIGYYGDTAETEVDESSPPGAGFLAEVCQAWEAAAGPAAAAGIRVVHPRIGAVVAAGGGMLGKLVLPFSLGLGGPVGGGQQWLTWIHIADLVAVIERLIDDAELGGPINAVTPNPVRQADLATTLGRVMGRPAVLPLPGAAVRLLFGQMGQEVLLASGKVRPGRLETAGFAFQHPHLESALRAELAR